MEVVGWILVLIGLLFSIGLHEIGHLIPAKKFGVKVSQYMIGFGPTIWSKTVGDTEYGFKWIPFGGYIRMVGMISPLKSRGLRNKEPSSFGEPRNWWQRVAEDTRAASAEDIEPGDEDRVFYKLSAPRKLIVMMGGPTMNLILAVVFIGIAMCGIATDQATTTLAKVSPCVSQGTDAECAADAPPSPALSAGLQPGDTLISYANTKVSTNSELHAAIADNGPNPTEVVVDRDGAERTFAIEPVALKNADGSSRAYIGVGFALESRREPISALPGYIGNMFTGTVKAVATLPKLVFDTASSLFTGSSRDQNGAIGIVGVARLAGDVTASENAGVAHKARVVLSFLGSLNMALFAFNLIPLLPLDGGHAAGAIWEGLRRQIAKRRNLPDPGPVDIAKTMPIAYVMFAVLTLMGILLIVADIVKPVVMG